MRASKIENKPPVWIWKDRIAAGTMAIIAGRPGGAKSLLGVRIARDVSKKGTVYLSQSEDHLQHMIGPRLTAVGANKSRVIVPDDNLRFPEDMDYFRKQVERFKIKLAVFDPVNEHLSEGVSRYNDSIRKATRPMKRLCQETGLSVIWVDHVLKNVAKNSHPINAIGGASSGLSAAGRMVYIVGRDPEDKDRVLMCCIKTGLRDDPEPFEFQMDDDDIPGFGTMSLLLDQGECPGYDVMALLHKPGRGGKLGRPATKREAAAEFLTDYLSVAPNHEARATDVIEDAKQYKISKRTLEAAKAELEIISQKRQNEWWWKAPPEMIEVFDSADT